jgi:2-phospho-L-lactate transferase/gluconeogenesis factor (CofD/UPF0052 family)
MTKLGETAGYGASMFASEIVRYIGGRKLDYLLVNHADFTEDVLDVYAAEGAAPVELDNAAAEKYAHHVMVEDLAYIDGLAVKHNSTKLARIVMAAVENSATNLQGIGLD